jgi:hypothetical protein
MVKQRQSEERILRVSREAKSGDRVVIEVCRTMGYKFPAMADTLMGRRNTTLVVRGM